MWGINDGNERTVYIIMRIRLVKLARFISVREQESVKEILYTSIQSLSADNEVSNDIWGAKNRILLKMKDPLSSDFLNSLLLHQAVASVVVFEEKYFGWESPSLPVLIDQIIEYVTEQNHSIGLSLEFRSIGRIPIHKQAIIDRLKRKKIQISEQNDFVLYIELKKGEKRHIFARIGRKFAKNLGQEKTPQMPTLVLFSPFSIQETADFFRLGLAFNTKLIFTNENHRVQNLIKQVQRTYFKGISKVNYEIIDTLESLVTNYIHSCYGFSLWGQKSSQELIKQYKKTTQKNPDLEQFFIFGNEETGLPLNIREKIPIFRIGTHSSEPLRASQAAAFAFGSILSN